VTMHAQGVGPHKYWPYPLSIRLENAIVSYARYIGKAFWPAWLAPFYPHPGNSLPSWQIIAALIFLLLITIVVFAARQRRYLTVGWLWFLVCFLPMIGLVQVGKQAMADRYAYQPFMGLFIMVCWQAAEWASEWHVPVAVLPTLSIGVLAALSVLTYRQIGYWKDDQVLYSHTLQVTKENWVGLYNEGAAYYRKGQVVEATPYFLRAHELQPSDPAINIALGLVEHQRGNLSQAIEYYKVGTNSPECDPDLKFEALVNMGYAYKKLGDPADAQKSFEAAEKLKGEMVPSQ
jgi:tetratricopeptide (TPR) repeat protein